MTKTLLRILLALTLWVGALAPAFAQTALTTTTLGAAITDIATPNVTVASATGITAPSAGTIQTWLVVDHELMAVRGVTGTLITVTRAANQSRPSLHISGATVTIAPSSTAFRSNVPFGQCTRTDQPYVPQIVFAATPDGRLSDGTMLDCLGTAPNGQWVQTTNNNAEVLGATVASPAGVLAPSGNIFKVSGTNAITGITVPAGAIAGFTIAIEPTGIFTWTTATNIAVAGTAVVGKILYFVWDGAKWAPSYIA